MVGAWSEVASYQPWGVSPEAREGDGPAWTGPPKWAELSFVRVTGLVLSTWDAFYAGLCFFPAHKYNLSQTLS